MTLMHQKPNIQVTTIAELLDQAKGLIKQHAGEITLNGKYAAPDPDVRYYEDFEAHKNLLTLAVLAPDGALIGYSVNIFLNHSHYSGMFIAINDALFISKEHRAGRLGLDLINTTEKHARERGAQFMVWSAAPESVLSRVLWRLKYTIQEINYIKEL